MKKGFWNGFTIFLMVVLLVLVWIASPVLMNILCEEAELLFGISIPPLSLGELFIALGTLFVALAFFCMILVFSAQQEQMDRLSRVFSERYENQEKTLIQQNFENRFFRMLDLFRDARTVTGIHVKVFENTREYLGQRAFDEMKRIGYHTEYYKKLSVNFNTYLRTVYRILQYIHDSSGTDRELYASLFKTQLSDSELHFLFFNCLQDLYKEKLKPLIEEYAVLENMDSGSVLQPLLMEYSINAFGENTTLREMYAAESVRPAAREPEIKTYVTAEADVIFSDL